MNKYYFVNIGAEVIWHPVNSDEQKVMQICTSVSYPVENDTLVSLIFSDKRGSVKVKASELTPKLTDFNQGYWCALQDAVSNGASDTVIQEMLRSAGFTYWECYWHIQNSDFQSEKIWSIIRGMFCQNPDYIDWNGVPYCPVSEENHKKYVLSEGDVVVARTGATVGYAKMVGRNIPDSVFASFLVRIRPIDDEYSYYFGLAITSAEFLDFVQTNAGGSAQPQANPPLLGEFELSIPNKQSLSEFNTKISSFLGVIESNETEISKLHEVKDTMVKMLSSS